VRRRDFRERLVAGRARRAPFGGAIALRRNEPGEMRVAQAEIQRDPVVTRAILDESGVVRHLRLLHERRVVEEYFRRHAARSHGRVAGRRRSRIPQADVLEDLEAVRTGWRPPVLETGLELVAGAEEAVDVGAQTDVGLMAIGIAEPLARRLGSVDVDAGGDVESRRPLLTRRQA